VGLCFQWHRHSCPCAFLTSQSLDLGFTTASHFMSARGQTFL
jgi:hypothetical protein